MRIWRVILVMDVDPANDSIDIPFYEFFEKQSPFKWITDTQDDMSRRLNAIEFKNTIKTLLKMVVPFSSCC